MATFEKSLFSSLICTITDPSKKSIIEYIHNFDPSLFSDVTFRLWYSLYKHITEKLNRVGIHTLFTYSEIFKSQMFQTYFEQTNKEAFQDVICVYLDVVATFFKIPDKQFKSLVFQLLNTNLSFSSNSINFGELLTNVRAKVICDGDGLKYKKIEVKSDIDNMIFSNLSEYFNEIKSAEILTYMPSNGQTEIIMPIPVITTVITELVTLQNTMCEISNQNHCKFVPFLMTCEDSKVESLSL